MNRELFASAVGLIFLFVLFGSTLTGNATLFPESDNSLKAEMSDNEHHHFEFKNISEKNNENPKGLTRSTMSRLDAYAEKLYKRRGFNGSIVIGQDGYMVYKKHVGYSNLTFHTTDKRYQ